LKTHRLSRKKRCPIVVPRLKRAAHHFKRIETPARREQRPARSMRRRRMGSIA
jgi:hypothetical protein